MWRINKVKTEDNDSTFTINGVFGLDYDHEELKTYSDIENKFKDFKIDEEFVNELIEEQCKSITNFRFFITDGNEDIYLFFINLTISSESDLEYDYNFIMIEENLPDLTNFNKENLFIRILYNSKFYKLLSFGDYEYEDDDEEETQMIPAIIENSFSSDNCIICLKTKPNILNFPCLHLSLCEECEKIGRFLNCSICRKEINRKVKI